MHLAQVNVARALEPLDSPALAGFMAALAPVNALADAAPGFVWRLQTEDGDATAVRIDDDPQLIVNLSVWESLEALWAFVYGGAHVGVMQRRRQWFERPMEAHLALWWVPAGRIPTVAEAVERLAERRRGPGPAAFDFKHPFTPGGEPLDPASLRILPGDSSPLTPSR
jgi:Domain of unknown function (DUF3291)